MVTNSAETTAVVRRQYEDFPYPYRNPADELQRTLCTLHEDLETMNHYCFQGRRDFRRNFRTLVAGGGTGDASIYLAEQLRHTNAKIVHLDLSRASIEIARLRAQVRGLTNIEWQIGSLLDLPDRGMEPFDYINCSGVLHHLDDPLVGLRALKSVLKAGGAMGLMLYGKYARTGIYQVQELLRLINGGEVDDAAKVDRTKTVLDRLPESNWFIKSQHLFDKEKYRDTDLYDSFLHSVDRPFAACDVFELIEQAELFFVEHVIETRSLYDPRLAFRDAKIQAEILKLPRSQQQTAAELYWGTLAKHEFWVSTTGDTIAWINEMDNVPFFSSKSKRAGIPQSLLQCQDEFWTTQVRCPGGLLLRDRVPLNDTVRQFLRLIDGKRTLQQIAEIVYYGNREFVVSQCMPAECQQVLDILQAYDLLLLRHASVPAVDEQAAAA